jgi:hypothetical protein
MPFHIARPVLPRIYLDLNFIKDLDVDVKTMSLVALQPKNATVPTIILNDNYVLNTKYIKILRNTKDVNLLLMGYKHFDDWRTKDGTLIGSYVGKINGALPHEDKYARPVENVRLKRIIQKRHLGTFKYILGRLLGKL